MGFNSGFKGLNIQLRLSKISNSQFVQQLVP